MKQMQEKFLQTQIEKQKVEKNNKKLEAQIKSLNTQIETITQRCTFLTDQINLEKMNSKGLSQQMLSCDVVEMSSQLTQFQNQQIYEKDKKISELLKELEQKNNEISKLKAIISISNFTCSGTEQKFQEYEQEVDKQKLKKEKLQTRVDKLQQTIGAEAQFRIELEHLRAENQIFSQLLGFAPSLENQGEYQYNPNSVQLKVIKNIKFPIKPQNLTFDFCKNCNREFYQYRSCCNPLYSLNDKLLYVPGDAFNFAQAFKNKYLKTKNDLEIDELMEILLFELNKIWYDREQNHLQLLSKHCKSRIQEIKRANSQEPLSQREMLQNIKRLKQQLKELQKENLEHFNQKFDRLAIQI
ncbi:unnamed protein product [Paramecium sonneborni]|uniref:Uncharacterized protein n=1 Tax=Paramecium sonneborni TaxID=65129 RepID=A0A8S1NI24_9CILI|nr:unnamed protein product [Paramecium sonneborni]